MQRVEIHLVSWERPKITELTIRTIARNTKREHYRLVVTDNGSTADQQSMLYDLQENGLIDELNLWDRNYGLEPARNYMMRKAESEYFICADNDCLPEPQTDTDWLEKLVGLMDGHPDYGAISCRTQVMIGSGNIFDGHEDDDITEFPHPGGSLRIMRTRETIDTGGWLGRNGRGTEERDICGKLHDLGFKTGFATHINTLHLFGDTTTDNWGYDKEWKPEQTGHSPDVWHPVFGRGDDLQEVERYAGTTNAIRYFA